MMNAAKQLFLISFRMEGINLERLMNLAGERNILLKDLVRRGVRAVEGVCCESDFKGLNELAQERGWKLTRLAPKRLSRMKSWLKRRAAVAVGAVHADLAGGHEAAVEHVLLVEPEGR